MSVKKALPRFASVVGPDWVRTTDEDLATYLDLFPIGDAARHASPAVVAPRTTEEVRAVVRIANELAVPLWPISRGKNFGYGGAAPVLGGSVILDLTRMNRIVEVNEKLAHCVIEPGVGFYDLYEHLEREKIKLWISPPGNSLGSVLGNALEHGSGISPYGDHAMNLCGLEVVLANGDVVRTGMGAMSNNPSFHLYRHAFGPGWDQMFTQSNFGVVTRAGMALMPEPPAVLTMSLELPNEDDIRWIVDVLGPLRTAGVIRQSCTVRNYLRAAALNSQRSDWYEGKDALPDAVIQQILQKLNIGWWNVNLRLYGLPEVNDAHARVIEAEFAKHTDRKFQITRWRQGEAMTNLGREPTTASMQMINWAGGRGAHVGFSPVLPLDGTLALEQFRRTRARSQEFGFEYYGSMYLWERCIVVIGQIFFNRDDEDMVRRLRALFPALIADAHQHGYGEYRTHIDFMDDVARSFDFNDHAFMRMNQAVKKALDPKGILAPGKQGIWPAGYRRRS